MELVLAQEWPGELESEHRDVTKIPPADGKRGVRNAALEAICCLANGPGRGQQNFGSCLLFPTPFCTVAALPLRES